MRVEQFVMAYRVDCDEARALLDGNTELLRPVLRINVEIIHDQAKGEWVRIELNIPVASQGKRGWLNLNVWESRGTRIRYYLENKHLGEPTRGAEGNAKGMTTVFQTDFLTVEFTGVGIEGGCPAEHDNDGCFYTVETGAVFVPSESIDSKKEYCDCEFTWTKRLNPAMGVAPIEILGAYKVEFERMIG